MYFCLTLFPFNIWQNRENSSKNYLIKRSKKNWMREIPRSKLESSLQVGRPKSKSTIRMNSES